MDQFWVVFHGILHQIWTNLYKNITTDAIKGNAQHMWGFWFILLWRYIIVVSFISIAFLIVKSRFLKVCVPIHHPWNSHIWEVSGSLLSQIWSNSAGIVTRGSMPANKNIVWKFFEGFEFLWKRDRPKFSWNFSQVSLKQKK